MSDIFGIGVAIKGATMTYFQAARRSGRTVSMVAALKDGDRVWFTDSREADRVHRLCAERGIEVECRVCDPRDIHKVWERGIAKGRTVFDHSWVERFYLNSIENSWICLNDLARETSGVGEAHFETRRKAQELARWPQVTLPKGEKK